MTEAIRWTLARVRESAPILGAWLILVISPAFAQVPAYDVRDVKIAEEFAAKLVSPDAPQFSELRMKALELAATVRQSGAPQTRSLARGRDAGIYADPRYQENVRTMVEGTGAHTRIFNGAPALTTEFPEVVAVLGNYQSCSGVLIAPNVVLTAAHCHCLQINQWVIFGNSAALPTPAEQTFEVAKSIAMRECSRPAHGTDVALLFLKRASTVSHAVLATSEMLRAATEITAVGFGQTEQDTSGEKRKVDIAIASSSCNGTINGSSDETRYGCVKDREMVAGMAKLKKDTCYGDSGGPAYVKSSGGKYLLAASTSRGVAISNTTCGDGGIYERLTGSILDWIRKDNRVSVIVTP
jgi:hypothetical protein